MARRKPRVRESWERVAAWLHANDASGKLALPAGASPEELAEAEAALGMTLPGDLRESYLTHNGSNRIWLFEGGCLMPLTGQAVRPRALRAYNVVSTWTSMREAAEGMRSRPNQGLQRTGHATDVCREVSVPPA